MKSSEIASNMTPAGTRGQLQYTGTTTLQNVTQQNIPALNCSHDEKDRRKKNQAGIGAYHSEEENDYGARNIKGQQLPSSFNHTRTNQVMNEEGSDAADKEEDVRSAQGGFLPPVMDNKLGGLRARPAPRKDWQDTGPI